MKLELKAIKFSEFNSEETNCYQGNLYLDGKKVAQVGNAGRGGCDYFHGLQSFQRAIELKVDLEEFCEEQLIRFLARRQLQSMMKKHVVSERSGAFYKTKGMETHPEGTTILNDLPFEKALDLFMTEGA